MGLRRSDRPRGQPIVDREGFGEAWHKRCASRLMPSIAQRLLRVFNAAPEPMHADAEQLTTREREVLVLVSKGCRLPELAERLQISRHTVSDHLKHIYRKLKVNSRAEATLEAARMGLVSTGA